MNRPNYQRLLDTVISELGPRRPSLLLHACCGPCSTYVLEYLTQFFDITLFFYNPNIQPRGEYDKRLYYLRRVQALYGVRLLECEYDGAEFDRISSGLEEAQEGGTRCAACFALRLCGTARAAREGGFEYFCTTLTVSRHKNAERINLLGARAAEKYGVKWLPSNFKKRGGSDRSAWLAEQLGLYRQEYCGCLFSRPRPDSAPEGKQPQCPTEVGASEEAGPLPGAE